jgi:hypothetical protein
VFLGCFLLGRIVNLVCEGVSGPSLGPLFVEATLILVLIGAQRILPWSEPGTGNPAPETLEASLEPAASGPSASEIRNHLSGRQS